MVTDGPPSGVWPDLRNNPGTFVATGQRQWGNGVTLHVMIIGVAKPCSNHLDKEFALARSLDINVDDLPRTG